MSLLRIINENANVLRITPEHLRQARGNNMHFIAEVPVQKFLELTTSSEESVQQIMQSCQTVDDYNRYASEGENIIMPFLVIDTERNKIVGHEGRHRAAAIVCSGAKTMPVSFRLKPNEEAQKKYGYFEAKFQMRFEDMPTSVTGEYNRGVLRKTDLNLIMDGRDKLKDPV